MARRVRLPGLSVLGLALLATACAAAGPRAPSRLGDSLGTGEARAAAWLEAHRTRPPMLRAFLQRMPKGGDLHIHVSGAVYAESFIAWAAEAQMCVETTTSTIAPPPCDTRSGRRPVADALSDPSFYQTLVDALSTRNLANQPQSGHNQFFAAFRRFGAVTDDRGPQMVAELAARAADQQVSYLEMMLTVRGADVRALGTRVGFDGDFTATRQRLYDAGLRALVAAGTADLDRLEQGIVRALGCAATTAPAGCRVARRYLQQTSRVGDPATVFAQLVYAFELAQADRRVVGINLVASEDDAVALRDYRLHMRMVGWLADTYAGVNVALHAGELTLGLVPPGDLRFHIREAVEVAKAKRIGHGVAVGYERDALQLMEEMKARRVLVEICLTSNDLILGVAGPRHPFPDYLRLGVPVALATDDEGVSRSDLTNEYLRATTSYGLPYRDLKMLARNSLTFAFLAGPSLWEDPATAKPVAPCIGAVPGADTPPACQQFLATSEKARIQWALEAAFVEFEGLPHF